MSEANLERVLARVADDLSSATEAIRDEVANCGKLLAPDSSRLGLLAEAKLHSAPEGATYGRRRSVSESSRGRRRRT
jgi:hypothetical protein